MQVNEAVTQTTPPAGQTRGADDALAFFLASEHLAGDFSANARALLLADCERWALEHGLALELTDATAEQRAAALDWLGAFDAEEIEKVQHIKLVGVVGLTAGVLAQVFDVFDPGARYTRVLYAELALEARLRSVGL